MAWDPPPTKAAQFEIWLLKEVGKPFVYGSEGPLGTSLKTWDCSELVQHGLGASDITIITNEKGVATGIDAFDGAWFQYQQSKKIPIEDGIRLPGALLFAMNNSSRPYSIGHVAVSLGNGYMIEARGKKYGVVISEVRREIVLATKVPELYVSAILGKV